MSDDKKTIRVDEEPFKEAKARKEANGQTWAEYLTDENRGGVDVDDLKAVTATPEDLTALRSDLVELLERIEASAGTVEERTGRIERTLDNLQR